MATQTGNLIDASYLYTQYDWYQKTFAPVIQQSCDEFFTKGLLFNLIGISKNVTPDFGSKESFFVTKIRIDKQHDLFFRSSEGAIALILDKVLGKAQKKFNINKMTDLEAKVVTAFNDYLYTTVSQLIDMPDKLIKRTNFDVIHLTLIVRDPETGAGAKFMVSVPEVLVKPESINSSGDKFSHESFLKSEIPADIRVGSTRISVYNLKNIEEEDIVVLDKSNSSKMTLKMNNYEKSFKVAPNMAIAIPMDYNNEGDYNMAETNLWDSLEVEMIAQFDKTMITLGNLKSIEENSVVDVASVYDNNVTLSVEGKTIAMGELVIVNDRYGVKIKEVIAVKPAPEAAATPVAGDDGAAAPAGAGGEDEFDMDDFDLGDDI